MLSFRVDDAYFVSDKHSSLSDLKAGTSDGIDLKNNPLIKSIPMLLKRRLSPAGRMAVGIGIDAIKKYSGISKLIYASRTGETNRCVKLLGEIANNLPLSPTEFSSSVHNADVGIASIAANFTGETTALAGEKDTLAVALAEAFASLKAGSNIKQILVVFSEDDLKLGQDEADLSYDFHGPYALGLVLSLPLGEINLQKENNNEKVWLGKSTDGVFLSCDFTDLSGTDAYEFAKLLADRIPV